MQINNLKNCRSRGGRRGRKRKGKKKISFFVWMYILYLGRIRGTRLFNKILDCFLVMINDKQMTF